MNESPGSNAFWLRKIRLSPVCVACRCCALRSVSLELPQPASAAASTTPRSTAGPHENDLTVREPTTPSLYRALRAVERKLGADDRAPGPGACDREAPAERVDPVG